MNRVIRLMHLAKLQARHMRRRLPGDTGSRLENPIAPNHLQRDFQVSDALLMALWRRGKPSGKLGEAH